MSTASGDPASGPGSRAKPGRRRCPALATFSGIVIITMPLVPAGDDGSHRLDAARFARLALDCLHREYPNKVAHVLQGDEDARPPRELTPVFFGCFDWHSAVHGHWLLVRLLRAQPDAPFAAEARAALAKSFTSEKVAGEVRYLRGSRGGRAPNRRDREPFERPYGLAWLLQLLAELREWDGDPDARSWREALRPLEEEAARRLLDWLPKLSHPIRTGEHSQTAFALGLVLDWARTAEHAELEALIRERARTWHLDDEGWKLAFEPGGQDFLSPGLAEADLLRRVLEPDELAAWLERFLPELSGGAAEIALRPAVVTDRTDGKLAHLDGLNLSRAWMLEGIAAGLPADDPRRPALARLAGEHAKAGLAAVTGEHYEGGHWLGSFAVYLVTRRGIGEGGGGR